MSSLAHPTIRSRPLKMCVFGLTAITAASTTFFLYYLYFYMRDRFGFHQTQNLLLASGLGFLYSGSSFVAGRVAQRFGNFFALRFGMATMVLTLTAASFMTRVWPLLLTIAIMNFGMCHCWPALEALMSEGEAPARLQSLVGLYNVSWAAAAGLAYFTGGAVLQGLGSRSLFFLPVTAFIGVLIFLAWFEKQVAGQPPPSPELAQTVARVLAEDRRSPVPATLFLRMGWLVNPMAYLTINTVVSTIPSLAERFNFRPMMAGFVCSAWMFARAAAFLLLRLWPRWHYRFRFLGFAFVAMILSFAALLIIPNLSALVLSQLVWGFCLGLMYYSSLFYSMDVGQTKGEHGGLHEAALGLGSGSGPLIAALSLSLFPGWRGSAPVGVCLLLVAGFGVLMRMRFRGPGPNASGKSVLTAP